MESIKREKVAWYIKWFASVCLVFGMSVRASGVPELSIFDLAFSFVGICGWLVVSIPVSYTHLTLPTILLV